jgi:hypothetical protein
MLLLFLLTIRVINIHAQEEKLPGLYINGYIIDNANVALVDKDFFKTDFQLLLSDTSFEVVGFRITWSTENTIEERRVEGPWVRITGSFISLASIPAEMPVTFENILVRKRRRVSAGIDSAFQIKSFYVTTTDAETSRQHRKNLAPCTAFLASHGGKEILWVRELLSGDLVLKLSDPSYTLVGAELEIVVGDDLFYVPISGDRVGLNHPEAGQYLRRFKPGSSVIFTKIKATKDGKTYILKNVNVFFK